MTKQSLPDLFKSLHDRVHVKLKSAGIVGHSVAQGDTSETVWCDLLSEYLPKRYQVARAFVIDSAGEVSDQIDVVIFDRQYTPFIFRNEGAIYVPAESVYAVFEAKQTINASMIRYGGKKIESVRRLHRTSLPIPHAGGCHPPKPLHHILGGILALRSDWNPSLGKSLLKNLQMQQGLSQIDMGCIASHGYFTVDPSTAQVNAVPHEKAATAFLLKLISCLQAFGSVPMVDMDAYAKWL
ncbi:hypothetical protein P7L68_00470 (plasmid) [Tistrella mobilis]|uniref:DUF6602 domain-containing protein n=1 Tax=Tistrella mobilis TaxID=171437 RepID=UPI003555FD5A